MPPQRISELKDHGLANEPNGKKRLLDVVSTLMDPRLNNVAGSSGSGVAAVVAAARALR